MTKRWNGSWAAAVLLALADLASAQGGPKAPGEAASAPPAPIDGKPAPRLLTPTERRQSGEPINENLPEGKAVPQISVPLGPRPPAPAASAPKPAVRPGTVTDAAARCQAEESDLARARCRDSLARERQPAR